MKIDEYYRDLSRIHLNGSLAALFPPLGLAIGNFSIFQSKEIMLLMIPFLIYSFVNFHIYLLRIKQSFVLRKNLLGSKNMYQSIFDAQHLLIFYYNTPSPQMIIYFPNGYLAGIIKKYRERGQGLIKYPKKFALYTIENMVIGYYKVKGNNQKKKIEVYDHQNQYVGCFEITKLALLRKDKKELEDAKGRFVGSVDSASMYMDEQICDTRNKEIGRLRRGWMPLEWSRHFPEANTPVLSFVDGVSEKDKLLRLSILIHEFFIER